MIEGRHCTASSVQEVPDEVAKKLIAHKYAVKVVEEQSEDSGETKAKSKKEK